MKGKFFEKKRRFKTRETRTRAQYLAEFVADNLNCRPQVDVFVDEYERLLSDDEYMQNAEKVFAPTEYMPSAACGQTPQTLGWSEGRGDPGIAFTDSEHVDGTPLSNYQKGLVAAHEKAHGILEPLTQGEQEYILSCFEVPESQIILEGYEPDKQAIELLVRMSQIKNYYQLRDSREFTKEDLDDARMHYMRETGLDNGMTAFFNAIAPEKENKLIRLMNEMLC